MVGVTDGLALGILEGTVEGEKVGVTDGLAVGALDEGLVLGALDKVREGDRVGLHEGMAAGGLTGTQLTSRETLHSTKQIAMNVIITKNSVLY